MGQRPNPAAKTRANQNKMMVNLSARLWELTSTLVARLLFTPHTHPEISLRGRVVNELNKRYLSYVAPS